MRKLFNDFDVSILSLIIMVLLFLGFAFTRNNDVHYIENPDENAPIHYIIKEE